jgi:hypothetical protein
VRGRVVVGAAVAVAALGGLAAVAVPLIRSSDAATTEIRVAADDPPPPETAPLPASIRPLWTTSAGSGGTPAAPVEGPTAVAAGSDRVAGLDPATGRERWSYRRGNARLCDWTARDGVVLALFAKSSGCRDLVGLDAATGSRRWYRTVEVRTDAVLTSGPGVAVVTAGSQLVAVDTVSGLNRWTYAGDGCPLDPVVVGRAAAATVARCPGGEMRLVGHDPYAEKAAWTIRQPAGSDPRVVAAEEEVAVLSRAGGRAALTGYVSAEGKDDKLAGRRVGSVADARLGYETGAPTAAVTDGQVVVVWTGRAAVAVDGRTRTVLWSAPASGPPTLAEGQVLLAEAGRLSARPAVEGRPATTIAVSGGTIPAGAALSRIGRLVVAAGADRLTAFG